MTRVTLTLAERSLLLRHRAQMNQRDLARLLGVSERTVTRIEAGLNTSGRVRYRFEVLEIRHKLDHGAAARKKRV